MHITKLIARGAIAIAAACAVVAPASSPLEAAPTGGARPVLSLRAASSTVELQRFGRDVFLSLGIATVAGDEPFEVHVTRSSYNQPIQATWVRGATRIPLSGLQLDDFQGFPDFYHVTVKRRDGSVAANRNFSFCPNGESARLRPDAPASSPYPRFSGCPFNPFTRGSVWGIQEGWGTGQGFFDGPEVNLSEGRYTATLIITKPYRQMFGLSLADVRKTVDVRVVSGGDGCPPFCEGRVSGEESPVPQPAANEPGADVAIPPGTPMPDLRSLPAFDISVDSRPNRGRDFLSFGANVWNAGRSPLVVDGFRRETEDIMDAYQYFFDTDGNQVAHARVGTMAWDPRDGHHHWHFKDFARYRLLDGGKQAIVRSRKEAFCLANTDAINYTVPGANWNPDGTDLHTACGDHNSLAVREVLDSGSGDTYFQGLPGQSFEITSLPNGTYFIEVAANPANRLKESNTANNVSYRKVILGGTPGHRTVRAPQVGLVEEHPFG